MKLNNKKGFSLVELSIVLIIVALLIAGVISGKSLINNSKMNVINSEVNTLKIAIRSYLDNNGITDYSSTDSDGSADKDYDNKFFNTLVEDGYLDEHNNFKSSDICYPSKISGGCWYYKYDSDNERFVLTLASKTDTATSMKAILDPKLSKQFGTKFAKQAASDVSKHSAIESKTEEEEGNKKAKLHIYFYDIFA